MCACDNRPSSDLKTEILCWIYTRFFAFHYIKKIKSLSRVRLFAAPWTVDCQAPPSMGFARQEYWSGLSFASPGESPQPRNQTWVS